MLKMFTVLWDNDGVLVDTEGMYFQACREVLGSVGIELSLEQFKDISLRQGESTFVLATEQGLDADEVSRLRQQRDHVYVHLIKTGTPAIPGAEEVLRSLFGRVRMGVVTSARREHFDAIHAKSGLVQYFDFVLTREDYVRSKPHPEPYLTALQRYDLDRDRCIVIEDSERGLKAASAAGLECVVVLSEWTKDGDFGRAVAVVEDLGGALEEILTRMSAS
jgi:HAD superfamily hydrolase (TIGR01509 family)